MAGVGCGLEYDQVSDQNLGTARARARDSPSRYARHRSISTSSKYDSQRGLLGAPAGAVRNIGVIHGYGSITNYNVRRPARTFGGCGPDVRNSAATLGSHDPGRAGDSDDRREAVHAPRDL